MFVSPSILFAQTKKKQGPVPVTKESCAIIIKNFRRENKKRKPKNRGKKTGKSTKEKVRNHSHEEETEHSLNGTATSSPAKSPYQPHTVH